MDHPTVEIENPTRGDYYDGGFAAGQKLAAQMSRGSTRHLDRVQFQRALASAIEQMKAGGSSEENLAVWVSGHRRCPRPRRQSS